MATTQRRTVITYLQEEGSKKRRYITPLIAQFFGVLFLTYARAASYEIANEIASGGDMNFLDVGIATGFVLMAVFAIVAPFSGTHLHPYYTIGVFVIGRFEHVWWMVVFYILAQVAGSLCAGPLLLWTFGSDSVLGTPHITRGISAAFSVELVLGTLFILSMLVSTDRSLNRSSIESGVSNLYPGLVLAAAGCISGYYDGVGLNPLFHLGPAVTAVNHDESVDGWDADDWVYYVAPLAAAFIAFTVYVLMKLLNGQIKDLFNYDGKTKTT